MVVRNDWAVSLLAPSSPPVFIHYTAPLQSSILAGSREIIVSGNPVPGACPWYSWNIFTVSGSFEHTPGCTPHRTADECKNRVVDDDGKEDEIDAQCPGNCRNGISQ